MGGAVRDNGGNEERGLADFYLKPKLTIELADSGSIETDVVDGGCHWCLKRKEGEFSNDRNFPRNFASNVIFLGRI